MPLQLNTLSLPDYLPVSRVIFLRKIHVGAINPRKEMSLEQAEPHVILAVDLIELLEINQQPADRVLAALEIVRRDFQRKFAAQQAQSIKEE